MKQSKILFATLIGSALFFTGCNDKTEKTATEITTIKHPQSKTKEVMKKTKKTAQEAIATTHDEVRLFSVDNSDGKITPESIEKAFTDAGFYVSANNDMNFPYKRDFNTTGYDIYNLAAFYSSDIVAQFIKEYPRIGLFAPMSMSIYTKKGEKTISIATLSTTRMAKITGIPAEHTAWKKLDEMLQTALKAALPNGKFVPTDNKTLDVKESLFAEFTFDMGKDWEGDKEDFENDFESALSPAGFSMPAFNELSDEIENIGYDFYEVYSICKIPVIYTVSKNHPEAGAYAPCSLYVYKKEGEQTVHLGYPTVYNWFHSMGIKDEASKKVLLDAQEKFNTILKKISKK
jgi:uncharacterized protein (DUF302 family)